ncbi:MAG TPA: DUF4331 family protein [Gemmatimonadaceae bacterium]|jgi:hypothetical protein|nr:DUF4331 family protein [Gemmatimonadaceae bacterium]
MTTWIFRRGLPAAALAAVGLVAALTTVRRLRASDHQDTPEVELSPRYDVNDVYAFPAATPGRIALVLGTSSPITPANTPSFAFGTKDQELYQIKIDNDRDGIEDLVFQVTFTGKAAHQRVTVRGPVAPRQTGPANTLVGGRKAISGPVNEVLGSSDGIQVFTGPRDDPFFIDLEQFFRIIPDRKPVTGPLSQLPSTPSAGSFRPAGQALDYVRGFNDMAIVIELPVSMLERDPQHPSAFGVWGTTSRARSN